MPMNAFLTAVPPSFHLDGKFVAGPVIGEECLVIAEIDLGRVREERQNFDPTGHYSRNDIFQLSVDNSRPETVQFEEKVQLEK